MIVIKKYTDYRKIKEVWAKLWGCNTKTSVYQSPEYVALLIKHILGFQVIHQSSPLYYLFIKDGKDIMILPLFKKWFRNHYSLLGYKSGCGYLDAIYDNNMTISLMNECMDTLIRQYPDTSILVRNVKETSLLGEFFLYCGLNISDRPCVNIHYKDSYDNYFNSLSKNTRQNIRTAYNRIERDDKRIKVECFKSGNIPAAMHKNLLDIYIKRQSGRYGKLTRLGLKFFVNYFDLGTMAERELKELETICMLTIDDEIAAFLDILHQGDTVVVPRLAINDRFNTYSPGMLLLNECAKNFIINSKIRDLDLTHGDEKYKLSLGGENHYCVEGNWPRRLIN